MATTYRTPGVYVEEISVGPKPIVGAATNVAAIVGRTEAGPVMEPTEVTSWNEFLALFGGYLEESYTPESVFGFFQNGGSSIWVVRVDDPVYARFQVLDAAGKNSFEARAATPGAWGGNLRLEVGRDVPQGTPQLYSSKATGTGSLPFQPGTPVEVQVESTAGAVAGMDVLIGGALTSSGSRVAATVDTVLAGNKLKLTPTAGAQTIPIDEDIRIAAQHKAAETELRLVTQTDVRPQDVILARRPDGTEVSASVTAATAEAPGVRLTLDPPGFAEDIEAVEMDERRHRFTVEVDGPASSVILPGKITYRPGDVPPAEAELEKLISPTGVEAEWKTNQFETGSSAKIPPGPATVLAKLKYSPFEETREIEFGVGDQSDLDTKLGAYQWLPAGSVLTLTTSPSTNNVDVERAGPGLTLFKWDSTLQNKIKNNTFEGVKIKHDLAKPLVLEGSAALRVGDWLQLKGNTIGDRRQVKTVNPVAGVPPNTYVVELSKPPPDIGETITAYAWEPTVFEPLRFALTVRRIEAGQEVATEQFKGLAVDEEHDRYYAKPGIVNDASTLVTVLERPSTATALSQEASLPASVEMIAPGGVGTLSPERFRLGFEQLERRLEPAICACPDALQLSSELDQAAAFGHLINHCETFRRYAVVDAPFAPLDPPRFRIQDRTDLRDWRLNRVASIQAGTYTPFVRLLNPRPGGAEPTIDVPPSGFVMGVMARTDNERGVWKAPANERVRGIVGLGTEFTHRHQEALNEARVNLLRSFPGRGPRVWGARNSTDDTQWLYTNVRRLFNYLETTIERNTEWVVFEPNDANTWLRVRVSVEEFLDRTWRAGGLAGATPEEAYRVRVGLGQTMTETEIDTGLMIIEVGVAPSKPAEFVVFRISHKRIQSE